MRKGARTEDPGQMHRRRHGRARATGMIDVVEIIEHGTEVWPMAWIVAVQLHRNVDAFDAGHRIGDAVNRVGMRHRADESDLVEAFREARQVLADANAGK